MSTAWRIGFVVLGLAAFAWPVAIPAGGQSDGRYDGPIIDMHMHASWQVDAAGDPAPFVVNCAPWAL